MNRIIPTILVLLSCYAWGSGGYDNGTATGKGKFKLDLTWNPFDRFDFGQTYAVMSYGITNRLDVHGYISHHTDNYQTWYGGIFYQFLNTKWLDLATAVGIRRRFDGEFTHVFAPQLLYTTYFTEKLYLGGSIVDVRDQNSNSRYGTAIDLGVFFQLSYKSKKIDEISIGIGGFHPATWKPNTFFLPTYSIDITFH